MTYVYEVPHRYWLIEVKNNNNFVCSLTHLPFSCPHSNRISGIRSDFSKSLKKFYILEHFHNTNEETDNTLTELILRKLLANNGRHQTFIITKCFMLYIWQCTTPSEREVKNNLSNFSPGGKVIEKLLYNFCIIVKHIFFSLNGEIGK